MPMERTASVEDMVGNLWRLGRTPSQAEFEQFFSNIAQVGSQQNLAAQAAAAQAAQAAQPETNGTDATGIPRVASIDLLRKMIMQGQQPAVAPAMVPNLMNPMAGMGAMQTGLGGAGLGAAGMIPGVGAAGINPAAAAAAAGGGGGGIPGSVAPPSPKVEKKPAKRAPAPKAKAPANKKTSPAPAKKGVKREASADPSDKASDDDLSDSEGGEGEGGKGKTTDEVRRQRRMLSNRESARRSRRRKLEHVATLEGQINQHKAENLALLERLRESEARVEAVVRENAQLKAEIVRMSEVAGAGGKPMERASSLQRIASAGNLAKSNLGGTASPQMSGDDSPRGFVPFRSLQSYENLLSLQAQGR